MCKSRGIKIHYCAELFPNDDSQSSAILKTLRRTMAAEYSRDLSEKVFAGMCRLARKGFKLGGAAGYGLRRLLVDETGSPRMILEPGQRKFLTTQHVKLILGPDEEVEVVRQIYSMYLNENMTVSDITRFLNSNQVPREVRRPWNDIAVHRILSHPKYAGCTVFGRFTTKMRSDNVPVHVISGSCSLTASSPSSRRQSSRKCRRNGETRSGYSPTRKSWHGYVPLPRPTGP